MNAEILIVGQGLAGTLLAWELEKAGVSFAIADAGPAIAASQVAAGIVNPITGRRLVKSWRIDDLLPAARSAYRDLEAELHVELWREMRMRRLYANKREARVLVEKEGRGELAPFLGATDELGFWIEGAAQVDLRLLLATARERWRLHGRLQPQSGPQAPDEGYACVVDCRGAARTEGDRFAFVPWVYSKGELLEIRVEGAVAGTILSDGHWVLPFGDGTCWVGATHEPGVCNREPTARGRSVLVDAAHRLLGRPFQVIGHRAGVRVNLPDKRPVAGLHPSERRYGLINGLGSKGVLWAPWLARQWVRQFCERRAPDSEVDVARFWPRA
jgi:glycine oxidase